MNKKENGVYVEWGDGSYFVRVKKDDHFELNQVPQPEMTADQSKDVVEFVKKFKMSAYEKDPIVHYIIKSLWRQSANDMAVQCAFKFNVPEENVHLIHFDLVDGKMVPKTEFWWRGQGGKVWDPKNDD